MKNTHCHGKWSLWSRRMDSGGFWYQKEGSCPMYGFTKMQIRFTLLTAEDIRCACKNLVHQTLHHARLPEGNGESLLHCQSLNSCCRETVNQTNNLERFSAHQGPGSWMFWEDYQNYASDYPRSNSLSKNSTYWCACTLMCAIVGNTCDELNTFAQMQGFDLIGIGET